MIKDQTHPKDHIVTIVVDVPTGIHRVATIDLMVSAGFSRRLATKLVKQFYVWQPFDGSWVITNLNTWLNFLTRDSDYVLAVQPGPGADGVKIGDKEWPYWCMIRAVRQESVLFDTLKESLQWMK